MQREGRTAVGAGSLAGRVPLEESNVSYVRHDRIDSHPHRPYESVLVLIPSVSHIFSVISIHSASLDCRRSSAVAARSVARVDDRVRP